MHGNTEIKERREEGATRTRCERAAGLREEEIFAGSGTGVSKVA